MKRNNNINNKNTKYTSNHNENFENNVDSSDFINNNYNNNPDDNYVDNYENLYDSMQYNYNDEYDNNNHYSETGEYSYQYSNDEQYNNEQYEDYQTNYVESVYDPQFNYDEQIPVPQQLNSNSSYQNEGNIYYGENFSNKKPKKKGILISIIAVITILLISVGYIKFVKGAKETVDLSQYEVEFLPSGQDGEGIAASNIKNIPPVKNSTSEIKKFLEAPAITYDKTRNLKNGDKVEVTLSLNKESAEANNIKLTGEFKRTFTVRGLTEKQTSSISNTVESSTRTIVFNENSSKDTKKLESYEVSAWAIAIHIKNVESTASRNDFTTNVWLGNDSLAYVNVKKGADVLGRYRVNGRGELEKETDNSWYVVSSVYTTV